ncbi:MAG: hypothetical protein ACRBC3_19660 [Burkholderiaceae bacterium]
MSERSITVTNPRLNGGRPTNIPSIWEGAEHDEDAAVDFALRSGQKFSSFESVDEAINEARNRSANLGREVQSDPGVGDKALSVARSASNGITRPFMGAAALLYKAGEGITSYGGNYPNPVSEWMGQGARDVQGAQQFLQDETQMLRDRAGFEGVDISELAGEVVSPVNAAIAMGAGPIPATVGKLAGYGARVGAASAGAMPVNDAENYWTSKGQQVAGGAVGGAVLTPIASKGLGVIGKWADQGVRKMFGGRKASEAEILSRIRFELGREDIDIGAIPEGVRKKVAAEVRKALSDGYDLDGAALLRKLDFDEVGVPGTQGQITRDPTQWTKEFNLRQVENAGEGLKNQVGAVRQKTASQIGDLGATKAKQLHEAGDDLQNVLRRVDEPKNEAVSALYRQARGADGRYAQMDTAHFAKVANDALDEGQLGYVLPAEARNILNDAASGEIPMNVNNAVQMESVLAGLSRAARKKGDIQPAKAIDAVLKALKETPIVNGDSQARAAFATAKAAARDRFQLHKVVPALKDVLDGGTSPDKFVDKFVMSRSAPVKDVRNLAKILPENGKQIVREQMAKRLESAAFGTNITGDTPVAVDRYVKALDAIGKDKLRAFFEPDQVDELYRLARVNAYVNQAPAGATPNRSGTGGALMNLFAMMKGVPFATPVINGMISQSGARAAMNPQLPRSISPVVSPVIKKLAPATPIVGGVTAGSSF